jgi:site-specific recombinase XerD
LNVVIILSSVTGNPHEPVTVQEGAVVNVHPEPLVITTISDASGVTCPLKEAEPLVIKTLSDDLVRVLEQARAPSTNRAYARAFAAWKVWAANFDEVSDLPANPYHIALYFAQLGKHAKSYSVIAVASGALTWAHQLAGMESPTDNVIVRETMNGLKRQLARPVNKKDPLEPDHITKLFDVMNMDSITDLRNTTIIVLSYYALLRFDEMCHIRCSDVGLFDEYIEITIHRSKTDQLRQGNSVIVARLGGKYCPATLVERYLAASIRSSPYQSPNYFLFRRCISRQKQVVLSDRDIAITYSSVREMVKAKTKQIGLDSSRYSTHSMRSGGASAAANSNVSERALQKHGRWACASSKDGYVKDKIETRLSVSKAIAEFSTGN